MAIRISGMWTRKEAEKPQIFITIEDNVITHISSNTDSDDILIYSVNYDTGKTTPHNEPHVINQPNEDIKMLVDNMIKEKKGDQPCTISTLTK